MAIHAYHDAHGTFPPAYVADERGVPMHSWRVLLLPYLDQQALYDEYRFDEPWNSPHNRKLAEKVPSVYRCPSYGHHDGAVGPHVTNYLAVLGPEMAFRGSEPVTSQDLPRSTPRTLLVVEVNRQSVDWTAPLDITEESFRALFEEENAEFNHPSGSELVMADGAGMHLSPERIGELDLR